MPSWLSWSAATATLTDIVKLFLWKSFRNRVVEQITDPQVQFFWKQEYPNMNYQSAADGVAPIANKLGSFLGPPSSSTGALPTANTAALPPDDGHR